jgi:hypothetical protein
MPRALGRFILKHLERLDLKQVDLVGIGGKNSGQISKYIQGANRFPPKLVGDLALKLMLTPKDQGELKWLVALSAAPASVEDQLLGALDECERLNATIREQREEIRDLVARLPKEDDSEKDSDDGLGVFTGRNSSLPASGQALGVPAPEPEIAAAAEILKSPAPSESSKSGKRSKPRPGTG